MAIPETLRQTLIRTASGLAAAGAISAAGYAIHQAGQPSPAIQLAMEFAAHYESSGRHIGTPYRDTLGKGQPWTVCNGLTGPEVVPGRYYSPADCQRLERKRWEVVERDTRKLLARYDQYNVWVQASFLDMVWNLGANSLRGMQIINLANAGQLDAACGRMTLYVKGTVNGEKVTLPGLANRRASTRELCAEWGRSGRFY